MTSLRHTLAAASLLAASLSAAAQAQAPLSEAASPSAQPRNVLQLSATGQAQAQQDLLTLTLSTSNEGSTATAVQADLRKAVDAALAALEPSAQAGRMEVKTGRFSVHPRHNRDGKISGWQGHASVVLQGQDFPRITQAAARAASMTVAQVSFGLSRELRARTEAQAQAQAIEQFKTRATDIAKAFGFSGYSLREVSVNSDGGHHRPVSAMERVASAHMAEAPAPIAVAPGQETVLVHVSGAVVGH